MDRIQISVKQRPVIDRLSDTLEQAVAYSAAIADNAIDEGISIPSELVVSFEADFYRIIQNLKQAASVLQS